MRYISTTVLLDLIAHDVHMALEQKQPALDDNFHSQQVLQRHKKKQIVGHASNTSSK